MSKILAKCSVCGLLKPYCAKDMCRKCYSHKQHLTHKKESNIRSLAYYESHKERLRPIQLEYARVHRKEQRRRDLLRLYGITLEEYNSIFEKQGGCCAICNITLTGHAGRKFPDIDHDHLTNKVRGLLCPPCNKGLGHFKDSKELLLKAAQYLVDPPSAMVSFHNV